MSLKDRLLLNPLKAGTSSDSLEHIKETVYQASEGSAFFLNEQRKDAQVERQVDAMVSQWNALKGMDLSLERSIIAAQTQKMDKDYGNWIVHIDMDAFFAAVEELERPDLRWTPMAVGSNSMLCTANYEARKYGVRSAMPGYIAKKLCPDLILIEPHFDKYEIMAREIRLVFEKYDSNYRSVSLDEAYLNLTSYVHETGQDIQDVVGQIREEIFERTRLTASAGISHNVMLAKVCSDINKPNGQYLLPRNDQDVKMFLSKLPIRKVPGIGRVLERILNGLGIKLCSDLEANLVYLYKLFPSGTFGLLFRAAHGVADTVLGGKEDRKGMSVERTFPTITKEEDMISKIADLSESLSQDLGNENLQGKTVTVKLKTSEFRVITRSRTLNSYICKSTQIFSISQSILKEELKKTDLSLRLIGIRISNFKPTSHSDISDFMIRSRSELLTDPFICPVCSQSIYSKDEMVLSDHVLACSTIDFPSKTPPRKKVKISKSNGSIKDFFPKQKDNKRVQCPICWEFKDFPNEAELYKHVDDCIALDETNQTQGGV